MKISIFGLGYVGCVCAGCLAKNGHKVIGVDLNDTKVEFLNQGKPTIIENGIDEIIHTQHKIGNISVTKDGVEAVMKTAMSFICVGTPSTQNGHLDHTAIFRVAEEIGKSIKKKKKFHTVIIRSTVLPGTNEKVTRIIEDVSGKKEGKAFATVSNPEFLREGSAVSDFFNPPYTLIGSKNKLAIRKIKKIYEGIDSPIIVTDIKTAEIIKHVSNSFHALKITFANEIGNISKKLKIDSRKVMEIFCMDKKLNISSKYLVPGFAYGGSCLPKDLKALKTIAHDLYLESPILESIERSNELQKKMVFEEIINFKKENLGFLGLSFKAGTDDLRNSPIVDIIELLLGKGFNIKIFDRNVHISKLTGANKDYILKKIPYVSKFITDDINEVIKSSDVVIIVNKEKEFVELIQNIPENKIVYDLANINIDNNKKFKNYIGVSW